jgi:hypothetical protein
VYTVLLGTSLVTNCQSGASTSLYLWRECVTLKIEGGNFVKEMDMHAVSCSLLRKRRLSDKILTGNRGSFCVIAPRGIDASLISVKSVVYVALNCFSKKSHVMKTAALFYFLLGHRQYCCACYMSSRYARIQLLNSKIRTWMQDIRSSATHHLPELNEAI